MKISVLIGRIFFSLIFLNTIIGHFSSETFGYAASAGVPFPNILVPISGIIAFTGALLILLGFKAKLGAWLVTLFLVPVTILMHNFWALEDPAAAQMQMVQFMKNLSMMGGALFITYFGAGPLSIDSFMASRTAKGEETIHHEESLPQVSRKFKDKKPERISYGRSKDKQKRNNLN